MSEKSTDLRICPVCNIERANIQDLPEQDSIIVDCPACSKFIMSRTSALCGFDNDWWTPTRRAALSHFIRNKRNVRMFGETDRPFISTPEIDSFKETGVSLPNRIIQMENFIRYLGDAENEFGDPPNPLPSGMWAKIGASSTASLVELFRNMKQENILTETAFVDEAFSAGPQFCRARLSLLGWQKWNEIHSGDTSSRDGFIAMQFGDDRLDKFIGDIVQKRVADELGVKIYRVNSPEIKRAEIIDNIMREAIEDAAFVLVELSHGNRGAYWEAGLAEGLGKPVIYLCEQRIWDDPPPDKKVHFDVNHRTTEMWDDSSDEKIDEFIAGLVATIKNSLR